MTLLTCHDGLIGDFLGVMPIMTELSKQDKLQVSIHPEAIPLLELLPKRYGIRLQEHALNDYDRIFELDIQKAFTISHQQNYYMSQAHFAFLNLAVPEKPPKAELAFDITEVPAYDYILAPFSRSLPPQERWPREQWQKLVDLLPDKSFCLVGHHRDDPHFVSGANVTPLFGEPIVVLMNVLRRSRGGLISVVSGPSHLSFHLSVKNYLLTNQHMTWGNNPDAHQIWDPIPQLQAEELIRRL